MKKEDSEGMKRAQTFSTDAVVAVVLFITAAILLFYLTGPAAQGKRSEKLQADAEKLPRILSAKQNLTAAFIEGARVDEGKLAQVSNVSYENLKNLLGIESEFCIYFEDDKGNTMPVEGGKMGLGSPLVNLSGKACNESISG